MLYEFLLCLFWFLGQYPTQFWALCMYIHITTISGGQNWVERICTKNLYILTCIKNIYKRFFCTLPQCATFKMNKTVCEHHKMDVMSQKQARNSSRYHKFKILYYRVPYFRQDEAFWLWEKERITFLIYYAYFDI